MPKTIKPTMKDKQETNFLNRNHKFNIGDIVEVINKKSHEYRQFGKIFMISRKYYYINTPKLYSLHKEEDLKIKNQL